MTFQDYYLALFRWVAFGLRRAKCWANCSCTLFPRFPIHVDLIHQRYRWSDRRTDRQTDGRTTCDRKTALCTKVHRAVKIMLSKGNRTKLL